MLSGLNYEALIIEILEEYFDLYKKIEIDLPIFIYLSFIKVKGYYIASELMRYPFGEVIKINSEIVTLPEIIINSLDENIPKIMKPAFDTIWNACGFAGSNNYSQDGIWLNRK